MVLLDTDVGLEIGTILYGSSADCPLYSTASLLHHIKTLLPGFIQNAVDYIKTVSNMTFTHVVLQLGSTDLLFASPEDVMSSYRKLIDIIQSLWPDAHIFVSGVFQRYMTKAKSFV